MQKVFYVLEIKTNMFHPYFHDYRKNHESKIFVEEEFLHKRIQKEDIFVDLTPTTNIAEDISKKTVWKLGGF